MSWFERLFWRRRLFGELSEEIQAHLEEKIEELVADGMSRKEATAAARRAFGNVTLTEEDSRNVWRWLSVEELLVDVRYGLRALRHNPMFTAVALLTIAIGIGANTAVFSVVNSVLLKPLNYPNAEQLVSLHQIAPGAPGLADFENGLRLSPSMYFTYAEHNRALQSLGVWDTGTASVTGLAEPEQVRTVEVSDGVLQALDVPPAVGRWLSEDDSVWRAPQFDRCGIRVPGGRTREPRCDYRRSQCRFDAHVANLDGLLDKRSWHESTFLRDLEDYPHDSFVKTRSHWQRQR